MTGRGRERRYGERRVHIACLAAVVALVWAVALGVAGGGESSAVDGVSAIDFGGVARCRYALFDRNMSVAAVDVPLASLYVVPREVGDPVRLAAELARLTGRDRKDVRTALEQGRGYVRLPGLLGPSAAGKVRAAGLPGVHLTVSCRRYYPHGGLASHFLGFVVDGRGVSGAEAVFDRELSGFGGEGGNVVLTLDFGLQRMLEDGFARIVGEGGRAVAGLIDVVSGGMLAMVDCPGFDPNRLWQYDVSLLGNDFFRPDPALPAVLLSVAGLGDLAVLAGGKEDDAAASSPLAVLAAFARQVNGGRPVTPQWKIVLWRSGRGFFSPAAAVSQGGAAAPAAAFVMSGRSDDVAYYVPAGSGDGFSFLLACFPADRPRYAMLLGAHPVAAEDLRALAARILRRAAALRPRVSPPSSGILAEARRAGAAMFLENDAVDAEQAQPVKHAEKTMRMPDLLGMSLRRALRLLQPLEAEIRVLGSGRVVAQEPPPGTVVAGEKTVTIRLGMKS